MRGVQSSGKVICTSSRAVPRCGLIRILLSKLVVLLQGGPACHSHAAHGFNYLGQLISVQAWGRVAPMVALMLFLEVFALVHAWQTHVCTHMHTHTLAHTHTRAYALRWWARQARAALPVTAPATTPRPPSTPCWSPTAAGQPPLARGCSWHPCMRYESALGILAWGMKVL